MKGFCSSFKKDPMGTLATWQDTREPWLLFAFTSILLVLLAHYLFQNWLHMLPCEQCVYIRYGNIVMAIGAFIVAIKPKVIWSKIVAARQNPPTTLVSRSINGGRIGLSKPAIAVMTLRSCRRVLNWEISNVG